MRIRTIAKRSVVAIIIYSSIAAVRPAAAFVWPSIDIAQVGAFVSDISNGVNTISNTKSQIDNAVQTVNSVGDQVSSITKFTADLKGSISKIGNISPSVLKISENVESSLVKTNQATQDANKNNKEIAASTIKNVNLQIEENAEEEEVQVTLKDAEEEIFVQTQDLNNIYEKAGDEINEIADNAIEQLKTIIPALEQTDGLTPEEREKYKMETENLIVDASNLKKNASEIIKDAQTQFKSEYSSLIAESFATYSQAVSDYYAEKINREDLNAAGEKLQQDISSLQIEIADTRINQLVSQAQGFVGSVQKLQEDILNSQSNSREYSDDDDDFEKLSLSFEVNGKYVFNYSSNNLSLFAKEIYFNKDISPNLSKEYQIFGLSKELLCHKMAKNDLKDLEKHTDNFRECVTLAKAEKEYICTIKGIPLTDKKCDPYDLEPNKLYKDYRRDGVYAHIVEDYSIANIVNNNRTQQFVNAWYEQTYGDMLNIISPSGNSGGQAEVDNTRNAYIAMGLVDLEAPKLWSWIRVTDTLQRSKESVQQFKTGGTLYLDGRDDDFTEAYRSKNGLMKNIETLNGNEDREIFPNVFLFNCNRKAEDISVSLEDKYDDGVIEEKEMNIAKCLYKYAAGASGRRPDPQDPTSTYCGNSLTLEQCTTVWKNKEIKAINDASFQTLLLATINNYKSSKDYINPNNLENDEVNIASLQEDMKKNTTARDDYASGAQISYYSTMQILSIVDADAQNLQTDILKYLTELDYNFFDESFNEEQ